jgi:protein-disulfide isomerase
METELPSPTPADPSAVPEPAAPSSPEIPVVETPAPAAEAAQPAKRNLRWLYALPVAFALGLIVGYFVFAQPLETKLAAAQKELTDLRAQASAVDTPPTQVKRYDVPLGNNPIFGPSNAPITIIEFSDYECPFCKKWHEETWPQIQANYGDKVRLVYRDFPLLGLHENAEPSAQAAHCAGDQGKYWEYHNALFTSSPGLGRTVYDSLAKQLGLNMTTFDNCLDTNKYQKDIQDDYTYASNLGVSSTPTFFINGLALVGAQPYDVFKKVIDMELNGEIPK